MGTNILTPVLFVVLVQMCLGNGDMLLDRIEAIERKDKDQTTRIEVLEHQVLFSNTKIQQLSTLNDDLNNQLAGKTKKLAEQDHITTTLRKELELLKYQDDVSRRKTESMKFDILEMAKRLKEIEKVLARSEDIKVEQLKDIKAQLAENTDEIEKNDVTGISDENLTPGRKSGLNSKQDSDNENDESEMKSEETEPQTNLGITDLQSDTFGSLLTKMVDMPSKTSDKGHLTTRRNERDIFKRFLAEGVQEGPVAFHAVVQSGLVDHLGTNQNIVFDRVNLNLGGSYHNQHGLFIAPKSGLYIFSTTVTSYINAKSEFRAALEKNGNILAAAYGHGDSGRHDQGSVTIVTQLNVGDEICVKNIIQADDALWGEEYTSFMGLLVLEM